MPKLEMRNSKPDDPQSPQMARIRDFTDLQVWQLAREPRKEIYALLPGFPPEEKFALAQQLRRAATSTTANIAEGFGRYSYQENIQFSRLARGSSFEIRDHLITARDQGFISSQDYQRNEALALRVIQTLDGYIRSTRARQKTQLEVKL